MSFKKYQQYPIVQNFKREWADKPKFFNREMII